MLNFSKAPLSHRPTEEQNFAWGWVPITAVCTRTTACWSIAWGEQIFDVNWKFPHISMQKRRMGIHKDTWGCMGMHEDCKEKIQVIYGDRKVFCVGNAWGCPHANFCALGPSPCNFLYGDLHGAGLRGAVRQGCSKCLLWTSSGISATIVDKNDQNRFFASIRSIFHILR